MSEKVLGFYKKDAEFWEIGEEAFAWKHYKIGRNKLVPVRLASESVGLKKLKEWCEENKFGYNPPRANIDELLKWAEKEAKKK